MASKTYVNEHMFMVHFFPTLNVPTKFNSIVIEGNIGLSEVDLINKIVPKTYSNEQSAIWDNFHRKSIKDKVNDDNFPRNAFKFQLMALLNLFERDLKHRRFSIRSLESTWNVFIKTLASRGRFGTNELGILEAYYKQLQKLTPKKPDLIIYLRCNPDQALGRLTAQNPTEHESAVLGYLSELHYHYEDWLRNKQMTTPVIVVDFDKLEESHIHEIKQALDGHVAFFDIIFKKLTEL